MPDESVVTASPVYVAIQKLSNPCSLIVPNKRYIKAILKRTGPRHRPRDIFHTLISAAAGLTSLFVQSQQWLETGAR